MQLILFTSRSLEGVLEAEEPPSKVGKMSQKDLYRPPTNEELNELKETENLFHSSLFRLQVLGVRTVGFQVNASLLNHNFQDSC